MKPPRFDYVAPETVDRALGVLDQLGADASVLAGGQSLMPLLSFRLVRPRVLVDVNGLDQLAYIRPVDRVIAIGAATRQQTVLASPEVRRACPLLSEAMGYIGHPAIRNRGTVGGSIAHADPAAELGVVAAALEAEMRVLSARGERTLGAGDFYVSYFSTALEPGELLVEVRFPTLSPGTGWSFLEVSRRHGDFAVVAVAALVTLDREGRCEKASVALGGVGGTPVRVRAVEEGLANTDLTEATLSEVAEMVPDAIEPESDIHASAEYRAHVAAVLVRRALTTAVGRARVG